jgi:lipoprotein-anchoring transpeptidase ErfK/SrfK
MALGAPQYLIKVNLADQVLRLYRDDALIMEKKVSTASNGAGEQRDSERTPRGWHYIRAKIGAEMPPNTVFVGRRPTGELYRPELRQQYPQRDWILTRIMWLCGLEPGKNRLGKVDTMRRYVYIHGCPDDDQMGRPGSHGCVKMHNPDVIELFDTVPIGTRVLIEE